MGATFQGGMSARAIFLRNSAIRGNKGCVIVVLMQKVAEKRLKGVLTKCVWVWGKGEDFSEVLEGSGDVCV